MRRIILAALLGGLAVFIWGAISHMVLPLGEMGMQTIPRNEEQVLDALRSAISSPGLYFFPGMDMHKSLTPEEQKAWTEKYKSGPAGIMVIAPAGEEPTGPGQLIGEVVSDIIAGLLGALILSAIAASFWKRTFFMASLGIFAWLSISVSYWIWYRFPAPYIFAELIEHLVGWFLGGMAIAGVLKRPAR